MHAFLLILISPQNLPYISRMYVYNKKEKKCKQKGEEENYIKA